MIIKDNYKLILFNLIVSWLYTIHNVMKDNIFILLEK